MSNEEKRSLLVHNVPEEVKREFKVACSSQEVPMRQKLIELMKQYTKDVKELDGKKNETFLDVR